MIPIEQPPKKPRLSPKKKAALYWLLGILAVVVSIAAYFVPPSQRIPLLVSFAIVTPWGIWSLFYVLRDE